MNNIFEVILSTFHVPYTKEYAFNVYDSNPYKNSLWGLVEMLSVYGIKTEAYHLSDLSVINSLESPAVIQYDGIFLYC